MASKKLPPLNPPNFDVLGFVFDAPCRVPKLAKGSGGSGGGLFGAILVLVEPKLSEPKASPSPPSEFCW